MFDGLAGREIGVAIPERAGSPPIRRAAEQFSQRCGDAVRIDPATEQFACPQSLHPMRKKRLLDMPGPHRQGHTRQQGLSREAAVAIADGQLCIRQQRGQIDRCQRNAQTPRGATLRHLGLHAGRDAQHLGIQPGERLQDRFEARYSRTQVGQHA